MFKKKEAAQKIMSENSFSTCGNIRGAFEWNDVLMEEVSV